MEQQHPTDHGDENEEEEEENSNDNGPTYPVVHAVHIDQHKEGSIDDTKEKGKEKLMFVQYCSVVLKIKGIEDVTEEIWNK